MADDITTNIKTNLDMHMKHYRNSRYEAEFLLDAGYTRIGGEKSNEFKTQ